MRSITFRPAMSGAALALSIGVLVGCASPEEPPRPSPSASAASLFASDAEALAAAEIALEEYWATANAVLRDGGAEADRFSHIVTDERLQGELETGKDLSEAGRQQRGDIAFDGIELQQRFMRDSGDVLIVTQCVDFSNRTLHEADGSPVDLSHVPARRLFETTLITSESRLLIDRTEAWPDFEC